MYSICIFLFSFLSYPRKKWYNPIMNILEYETYHEEKTHGDMEFPYNTYLCSIPQDFSRVPLHWHDELELVYVKKGAGLLTLDFCAYPVKAPAIALILPGRLHSIKRQGDACMEYENIMFHPNLLLSKAPDVCSQNFLLPLMEGRITVPALFTPVYPYYSDIAAPIDACDEICRTKPQGYEFYVKSQLYQFFFVLSNRCRNLSRRNKNAKSFEKLKLVLKYVENRYTERISIADAAAAAGFSESHFMRYFKETMGTSFIEYLKDYRLTMATRLLSSSDSTILAVASEVGFESLSYFNRVFKARYHMTPNQFRHMQEQPPHH